MSHNPLQQHSRDSSWASFRTAEDTPEFHDQGHEQQSYSLSLKRSHSAPDLLADECHNDHQHSQEPSEPLSGPLVSSPLTLSSDDQSKKRVFSRKLGFFNFLQKMSGGECTDNSTASGSRSVSNSTVASNASNISTIGTSSSTERNHTGLLSPPASPSHDQNGFIEYLVVEKSSAVLKNLRKSTSLQTVLDPLNTSLYDDIQSSAVADYKQKQKQNQKDVLDLDIPSASRSSSGSTLAEITANSIADHQLVAQDACSRALRIPEILTRILQYVDEENLVPRELAQRRRKPMSLRHAMLIYGDSNAAHEAWAKAQSDEKKWSHQTETDRHIPGGIHSCLLVNRLWYSIAVEVLYKKLHFRDAEKWTLFAQNSLAAAQSVVQQQQDDEMQDDEKQLSTPTPRRNLRTTCFVVHKINTATQEDIERIGSAIGGNLQWLELYTCPFIVPTKELLISRQLKKLVLPGCSNVSNKTVALIAQHCPELEHLDLRACEQVSDWGLKQLGKHCRNLKLLNVGRTNHGELITYRGIKYIARLTKVDTLGLAGCDIDDRAIWEIAVHRGSKIERLSLNNCVNLTNESIPRVLPYTYNLSVLELRGCVQITNMKPIILFKRYRQRLGHPPLIEGCEVFEMRTKEAEWMMEMEASRTILADCLEWIYSEDEDVPFNEFLSTLGGGRGESSSIDSENIVTTTTTITTTTTATSSS